MKKFLKELVAVGMFVVTSIFSQVVFAEDNFEDMFYESKLYGMGYLGFNPATEPECWVTKDIKNIYKEHGYRNIKFKTLSTNCVNDLDFKIVTQLLEKEDYPWVIDGKAYGVHVVMTNDVIRLVSFSRNPDEVSGENLIQLSVVVLQVTAKK